MRVRVKICGITRLEDALAAVEAGADALGFMFYEPSPRFVAPSTAESIIRELPPFVAKTGVFVNAPAEFVRDAAAQAGLDTLQFHGEEAPEYCRSFGLKVIKSFRVRDEKSLAEMEPFHREAWLLDAFVAGKLGGTGEKFNWDLAVQARSTNPRILLAGGLTPDNAAEAARKVRPFALDVSSGVEFSPGKKDAGKVAAFIHAVRSVVL